MFDVIVVGGSYAGMAASLQLLRARRSVLVVDAGERRNRFADQSHGFLGQDGADAAAIASTARQQLEHYPTLTWRNGTAIAVTGQHDSFQVDMGSGETYIGRRILLATGVSDQFPNVTGLLPRWGKSVFHCPYCHGYELNQGSIGVIATGPMSVHQAELLADWGTVTFLSNGIPDIDERTLLSLRDRNIKVEQTSIREITGVADVHLTDGRLLSFAGLFTSTYCVPSSPLADAAGCELEQTPMGLRLRTDAEGQTSVRGVFACGDLAQMAHSLSIAVGSGAMAGVQVHRSLLWPEGLQGSTGAAR